MLNLELARIVTAERRRETDQAVRLSPHRIALAERFAELKAAKAASSARLDGGPTHGTKPALGPSR
jgi:hypothetical protein